MERIRTIRPLLGLLLIAFATPSAGHSQEGITAFHGSRHIDATSSNPIDRVSAWVTLISASSSFDGCYIGATYVRDNVSDHHLETGSYRCFNTNGLDGGECPTQTLHSFVEQWWGGTDYRCRWFGAVTGGLSYDYEIGRTGSASNAWWAKRDTVQMWGMNPLSSRTTVQNHEWAEATAGHNIQNCPWNAQFYIEHWYRYKFNVGWTQVTSALQHNDGCWTVAGMSGGAFHVTR